MLNSLASDVIRVMMAAPTRQKALSSLLMGISEITGIHSLALFRVNLQTSCLEPLASGELSRACLRRCRPRMNAPPMQNGLGTNSQIIVDTVDSEDAFHALGASAYALFSLVLPGAESTKKNGVMVETLYLWLNLSPPSTPLTAPAIGTLRFLSQQAALVLENLRIRQELSGTNKRLKGLNLALNQAQARIDEDLNRARSIQKSLLPQHDDPALPVQSAYRYLPAGVVGGDYFDCFQLEGGRVGMVIADVSGHGIAASMIMSMFKVLLKTLAAGDASPVRVLKHINSILLDEIEGAHFITAFYAVFDKATRKLTYCNAGHIPQYLLEATGIRELTSQGLFLGSFSDTFLTEDTISIGSPARLVLLTDGLTESADRDGRLFSRALEKLLERTRGESPAEAVAKVMEASMNFHGKSGVQPSSQKELSDDITVAILDL